MFFSRTFLTVLFGVSLLTAWNVPAGSAAAALLLQQNSENNCAGNLQTIYKALRLYAEKNKGKFPVSNNFDGLALLEKYGLPSQSLYCASHKGKAFKKWNLVNEKNCSYVYFGGFTLNPKDQSNGNLPLVCDKLNDKHVNVLLVNGTVVPFEIQKRKDKITSYRMLIDALNAQFNYSPRVLKALQLKAAVIDNGK